MILVTGATGHIGNVLTRKLLQKGHQVRAFVTPGDDETPIQGLEIEVAYGDVTDLESVRRAMPGAKDVFHLAAIITILPGRQPQVVRVNVDGTCNMLQAAQEAGLHRFVYTSSIHALQRAPHGTVIDESLPYDPDNHYGEYDRSKARATLAVMEAARSGLDTVVLCPTGVVGPYDYRVSSLTASFLSSARQEPQTIVQGSAYDFVDVNDVADGIIAAYEKGRSGENYILSGECMASDVLHQTIGQVMGQPAKIKYLPLGQARILAHIMGAYSRLTKSVPVFTPYALEVLLSNSNISHAKATRELGYHPRPLRQSIAETIAWFRENRHQFPNLNIP